jgi:hypothetical protein
VTGHRQQFNVAVEAALIRRVKHRGIDVQLSLADFVTQALEHWLAATAADRAGWRAGPAPHRARPRPARTLVGGPVPGGVRA